MLSIDLEDYFHFIGSRYSVPIRDWDRLESHVCRMTEQLLETLGERTATFFCLGWVGERFPGLIRAIVEAGHEIGSHGMYHEPVFLLGKERFRQDVLRAKGILEDCCGMPVQAYRAPGFSVRAGERWFFPILRRTGHTVDSSIFPGLRTLGGIPDAPCHPYALHLPEGDIHEIPVSTSSFFGTRTAFCGGGFFRFFPYLYIRNQIRRINASGHPAVVYLHPRDIDTRQPRLKLEPVNAFMYHYGLSGAEIKWRRLMNDFTWTSFGNWLANAPSSFEKTKKIPFEEKIGEETF